MKRDPLSCTPRPYPTKKTVSDAHSRARTAPFGQAPRLVRRARRRVFLALRRPGRRSWSRRPGARRSAKTSTPVDGCVKAQVFGEHNGGYSDLAGSDSVRGLGDSHRGGLGAGAVAFPLVGHEGARQVVPGGSCMRENRERARRAGMTGLRRSRPRCANGSPARSGRKRGFGKDGARSPDSRAEAWSRCPGVRRSAKTSKPRGCAGTARRRCSPKSRRPTRAGAVCAGRWPRCARRSGGTRHGARKRSMHCTGCASPVLCPPIMFPLMIQHQAHRPFPDFRGVSCR